MKKGVGSSVSAGATEIKLRNKFTAKIPEEMNERFIQEIRSFIALEEKEALNELWKMTYAPEEAMKSFGFTIATSNDGQAEEENSEGDYTVIQKEWFPAFRNELRFQYANVHKGFPMVTYPIPEECEEAFKALQKAEGSDTIVATICFDACYQHVEVGNWKNVERSIHLLNSDKESFRLGGMRNVRFSYDETTFLKPYATHLAAIVEALYENWKKKQVGNRPMSGLGQLLQEKGFELTEQEEDGKQDAHDEEQLGTQVTSTPERREDPAEEQHTVEKQQRTVDIKASDIYANTKFFKKFSSQYQQKEEAGKKLEEAQREYDQTCQQFEEMIDQLSQMGLKIKEEEIPIKVKAISMILQGIAIMES